MRSLLPVVVLAALAVAPVAHAAPITYRAELTGEAEFPPVDTPGAGFATLIYDPVAHTMALDVEFENLIGNTTASHVHCCTTTPFALNQTAGVATQVPSFVGFPLGVQSGTYNSLFDLTQTSSWNPAFIAANGGTADTAEAAFALGLAQGRAYLNIHSSFRPGGEIRGFLVPEPATVWLFAVGAACAGLTRRRYSRV